MYEVQELASGDSSPLRAACFTKGNFEVIKYLILHGADVNSVNEYNHSCLMSCAYVGDLDALRFLIAQGANVNESSNCQQTALHYACQYGYQEIVETLLENGALLTQNDYALSPLLVAAENCHESIVLYLLQELDFSRREAIEALELMGASYICIDEPEPSNIEKGYNYLKIAMRRRYADPNDIMEKNYSMTIEAYGNRKESQTLEELRRVRGNNIQMLMEGLIIRERILGPTHPSVVTSLFQRGGHLGRSENYNIGLGLWKHGLRIQMERKSTCAHNFFTFIQGFTYLLGKNVAFDGEHVVFVAKCLLQIIESELGENSDETDNLEIENHAICFVHLIAIFRWVAYSENQVDEMREIVRQAVKINPRTENSASLLHLSVCSSTTLDDIPHREVVKFPCPFTTNFLLKGGANTMAVNNEGDSPLHLIVKHPRIVSDFDIMRTIICDLVENGAHLDSVNRQGLSPRECACTNVAVIFLSEFRMRERTLKCLAARAVVKYGINYKISYQHIPKILQKYIQLHDPTSDYVMNRTSNEEFNCESFHS